MDNVTARRALEREIKARLADKIADGENDAGWNPLSENAKTGDKNPVTNPRKRKTGLSVAFSIAETCNPTEQCRGCYASEPNTHSTYDNKIIKDLVNVRRVRRNPFAFASSVTLPLLSRARFRDMIALRTKPAFGLRWLSAGDLTPAIGRSITAWLDQTRSWAGLFGKPLWACVFSRKPREVNRVIDAALADGTGDRLAVNFSVDGSSPTAIAETVKRLDLLGTNRRRVRLVQYACKGDYLFDEIEVLFPHHDKHSHDVEWVPEPFRSRVCPAIANRNIGCMNCGRCYEPTVGDEPEDECAGDA